MKYSYIHKEVFERLANTQIAAYDAMISDCNIIAEVCKKFDGKVVNKRFITAIQEQTEDHISFYTNYAGEKDFSEISIYTKERSFRETPCNGGYICGYIEDDRKVVFISVDANKRLNTAESLELIEKEKAQIILQKADYQNVLDNYEYFKNMQKELKKHIQETQEKMPHFIRPYYTNNNGIELL